MIYDILPVNSYQGNGVSTQFDFDFYIENASQLNVYIVKEDNSKQLLTYNTDYTIHETGNPNGSYINFPIELSQYDILSSSERISLELTLPKSQSTEYNNSSLLNLQALEYSLDYLTRLVQITDRKSQRAIKVPEGVNLAPDDLINDIYQKSAQASQSATNAAISATSASASAINAGNSATSSEANKINANIWAEGTDAQVQALGGVHSSKGWANTLGYVPITSIGMIFALNCTADYVPSGALPCDGTEYSKSQFNDLWTNYLTAQTPLLLTCSYADYQTAIITYGQCPMFAIDSVNNKFKAPTIKDGAYITQAKSDSELGKCYNESLPNITGSTNDTFQGSPGGAGTGAFTYNVSSTVTAGSSGSRPWGSLDFNAHNSSSTYQDNAKVQGDNIRLRYFVQVANGQINQSQMDWSSWASSLQGKLNTDVSTNISLIGKSYVSSLGMPSSRYVDLTLGASGSTYTAPANGYFAISKLSNSSNQHVTMYVVNASDNELYRTRSIVPATGANTACYIAIKQGYTMKLEYTSGGTTNYFRFIYAEGEPSS